MKAKKEISTADAEKQLKISQIKAKIDAINSDISRLEDQRHDCEQILAEMLTPIRPGDIIETSGYRAGQWLVGRLFIWCGDEVRAQATKLKKDGSLSAIRAEIWLHGVTVVGRWKETEGGK